MIDKNIIQRLVVPEPGINTEAPLFFHCRGGYAGFDTKLQAYFVQPGATISFDSYFNAFPAHLYDLNDDHSVAVMIRATGKFIVNIILARHGRSWEQLYQAQFECNTNEVETITLPNIELDGLIYVEIVSLDDTFIYEVDYCILGTPYQDISLTAVITTFKRNDAIQKTGTRINAYFKSNADLLTRFQLLVIDNGGETDSIPFDKARVIKNPNLGGAGGFTRGLMEVVDNQLSSHVLFMDDDASFFPESLRRTISALQFSKIENLAVCGAMITESHKWRMWENAATFDQRCRPIDNGRDLRNFQEILSMSVGQPRNAKNKYAGWWYFCFPISSVKVWPFPFFVRGDDSYFSLSNNFDIITMPGVVAHQEDFFTKQTPLTLYLDMRYHIVHHLTFDNLEIGKRKLIKLIKRYFDRFNNSYHYESAEAINLAIEDVLRGSEFWEHNADMAERRKHIASITNNEKIQKNLDIDITGFAQHSPRRNRGKFITLIRSLTLNGHLLPKVFYYKKGLSFPLDHRAIEHDTFRRPLTLTIDVSTGNGYLCNINKKAFFSNRKRFNVLADKLGKEYLNLGKLYRKNSSHLTSKEAWSSRFRVYKG